MFERYTEKARRAIFFARYEASQLGCQYIATEHLLLGVFREDTGLANHFLRSHAKLESIRHSIEQACKTADKIAPSVDLPLSHESKRALAFAAEESERMNHGHIDTAHLLVGLLREEKSFAAQLLHKQGLTLDSVRDQVQQSEQQRPQSRSASFSGLDRWFAACEAGGGIWTVKEKRVANRRTGFAIYANDPTQESDKAEANSPAAKLAEIQKRIDFIAEMIERSIASHEFEKARFYSDEERKERENLRSLCEQFHLEEPRPRVPLLRIEMIRDERFSEVQKRCDAYITEGVTQVWLLDPDLKRAYTVTKTEGLREFRAEILRIANPALEIDLRRIFD